MPFVVDASIALSWCMPDEGTPRTDGLLDRLSSDDAHVPAQWPVEVVNGLVVGERRRRLTEAESAAFLSRLLVLNFHLERADEWSAHTATLALARAHGLTAYDASYLELAMRLQLALATDDQELRNAAHAVGVELL